MQKTNVQRWQSVSSQCTHTHTNQQQTGVDWRDDNNDKRTNWRKKAIKKIQIKMEKNVRFSGRESWSWQMGKNGSRSKSCFVVCVRRGASALCRQCEEFSSEKKTGLKLVSDSLSCAADETICGISKFVQCTYLLLLHYCIYYDRSSNIRVCDFFYIVASLLRRLPLTSRMQLSHAGDLFSPRFFRMV